ncbi:MAG: hypothetical protein Q9224_007734, partial [Gallowayella concinna]
MRAVNERLVPKERLESTVLLVLYIPPLVDPGSLIAMCPDFQFHEADDPKLWGHAIASEKTNAPSIFMSLRHRGRGGDGCWRATKREAEDPAQIPERRDVGRRGKIWG